jgi:hypothetical protein
MRETLNFGDYEKAEGQEGKRAKSKDESIKK